MVNSAKFKILSFVFGTVVFIAGCTSPLKSDDPATRLNAVAKVVAEDDLFLIAMNLGLRVSGRSGSYCNAVLYPEQYSEDVRVAAVKRMSDPVRLLKCATWCDGDLYYDPAIESGTFVYNEESYWVHDAEQNLKEKVSPGDAVRAAAEQKLCENDVFARIPAAFEKFNFDGDTYSNRKKAVNIRTELFPGKPRYSVGGEENAFVDYYASVKKDNPLNAALARIVRAQNDQFALCAFIIASRENGAGVYADAVDAAINALDGSNQVEIIRAFEKLFLVDIGSKCSVPAIWGWKLLDKIKAPSEDCLMVMAKLGYGVGKNGETNCSEVDRVAEAKFSDAVWAKCYCDELFAGYSRSKMVKNIRTSAGMERFLINVRKINVDDVDVAFALIKDAETLAKIKSDCYLKVVAEKAEVLHFAMTYQKRLEVISKMSSKVERALAANEFRNLMKNAEIEGGRKSKLSNLLEKWINVGADQIIAEAKANSDITFSVAGFHLGMKNEEAKLLFECRYPDEEISWSADGKGLVDRINFGTTFLAKVYRFNAQTWSEWIDAFSQKTGNRFVSDELKDEKRPIGGRGTIVKVSQKVWRCQNNRKDLTITYFGDKNVQEIEPEASGLVESVFKIARGVTGGDIVKEVVLEGARHWANKGWESDIGGYPGMLRVERGTVGPGGTRKIVQPTSKSGLERTADSVKDTWDAMKDAAPAVENFMNNLLK